MKIILHSSKTMRVVIPHSTPGTPEFISEAKELVDYIQKLDAKSLAKSMKVSQPLANKVQALYANWSDKPQQQSYAIDSFVGDIYSGLRADSLSHTDRDYADKHLRIFSGLYGVLKPFDGIMPYRLEMMYRLPDDNYRNLYSFWHNHVQTNFDSDEVIVNTSSNEYFSLIEKTIDPKNVITPRFLTWDQSSKQAKFVVVHAKIARGAFARWLIQSREQNPNNFSDFADLNYQYNAELSKPNEPVFVCHTFGGIGLSMRLKKD